MGVFTVELPKLGNGWKNWTIKCSGPDCDGTSFLHALARKRTGIVVGADWFCSAECFEPTVAQQFRQRMFQERAVSAPPRARMPLGLLLLSKGYLQHDQLRRALAVQQLEGGRIGEVLQKLGFVTEEQVTSALAAQWGYPVFPVRTTTLAVDIQLPKCLSQAYSMVPLHSLKARRQVFVGLVNRIEHRILQALEHMTGCTVVPCFITPSDYARLVAGRGGITPAPEVLFEHTSGPGEIARITKSYAVQIGAEEARVDLCGSYAWVRLRRGNGSLDIVFDTSSVSATRRSGTE